MKDNIPENIKDATIQRGDVYDPDSKTDLSTFNKSNKKKQDQTTYFSQNIK